MSPDAGPQGPSVADAKRALMDFGQRADAEINAELERARTGMRRLTPAAAAVAGVLGLGLGRFGLLGRRAPRGGRGRGAWSSTNTGARARGWIGGALAAGAMARHVLPVIAAIIGDRRKR